MQLTSLFEGLKSNYYFYFIYLFIHLFIYILLSENKSVKLRENKIIAIAYGSYQFIMRTDFKIKDYFFIQNKHSLFFHLLINLSIITMVGGSLF